MLGQGGNSQVLRRMPMLYGMRSAYPELPEIGWREANLRVGGKFGGLAGSPSERLGFR